MQPAVLWVAAVHASAGFDRELPVRQMDRLIEVFSDRALLTVRNSDRRLCADGGYPMILRDEELRVLVEQALAAAGPHMAETC